jgi:hypothetical protein
MKRFLVLAIAGLLIVGLASAWALARTKLDVWYTSDNADVNPITGEARAYKVGDAVRGQCNKFAWDVNWKTRAEVAQWIDFTFTSTEWHWFVRKPGDFYTDCIEFLGKSNGPVVITFKGFEDLAYLEGESVGNRFVETWYQAADDKNDLLQKNWMTPDELNAYNWLIDEHPEHVQLSTKLWNRIKVVECNSAGIYQNTGTISLTLQTQMPWIVGNTGAFYTYRDGWGGR